MSYATLTIRDAFEPRTAFVRIQSEGFLVGEDLLHTLEGCIDRIGLRRKRFEKGRLACDSHDGVRARDGTDCEECRHARCRPHLRIDLRNGRTRYVVDLPATSAHNLFALEDEILAAGDTLTTTALRLHIIDRGEWGEVAFERQ